MDIKINDFCLSKDTVKKVKRQPKKWGEIFANHLRIPPIQQRNNPIQKRERLFSKEGI